MRCGTNAGLLVQLLALHGSLRKGVKWCAVWYGVVRYGGGGCGVVWYGMVWCGVVWCGMVWYGVVWSLREGGCDGGSSSARQLTDSLSNELTN